jgi:hypothetical protein
MRKFAFFTVFFLVCFSLFGQTLEEKPNEYKIFVSPIAGYGREKDNDYFYKQLGYEVFFQHHMVVESQDGSNYIFQGTIEPVGGGPIKEPIPDHFDGQRESYNAISEKAFPPVKNAPGRREYFSIEKSEEIYFLDPTGGDGSASSEIKAQMEEKGYYFILEMLDSGTGDVLGKKKLLFFVTDASVSELVSIIVYDLLSDIPVVPVVKRGDSRDRWLYFETSAVWMPKIYYGGYEAMNLLGFGMKLGMEFHFISLMSLGVGVQITQEQIAVPAMEEIADLTMEIPAAIKFVFKIDDNYALEPYGGASWNNSVGGKIQPSKYSWFAGVQFGIKDISETGMFVIDPRFSMDFYDSSVLNGSVAYKRYCFQLGLGYKFGAIQKKTKVK